MAETSIFLTGNLTGDPELTTAPAAPPGRPSGWPWPAGSAMPRAGGTVSRRSPRWWSGATRPCTPRVALEGQPGRGHRPAGAAVLAVRRRHRPLAGRGRGRRAGTEPAVGNGNHDQGDAGPRRVTITGAASLRMVKRDAGRWGPPLTRRRSALSRQGRCATARLRHGWAVPSCARSQLRLSCRPCTDPVALRGVPLL
jgi:hypothetical protein